MPKLSKHAKERYLERYSNIPLSMIMTMLDDPGKSLTIRIELDGAEVRQLIIYDRIIHVVISPDDKTIITMMPGGKHYLLGPLAKKYQNLRDEVFKYKRLYCKAKSDKIEEAQGPLYKALIDEPSMFRAIKHLLSMRRRVHGYRAKISKVLEGAE